MSFFQKDMDWAANILTMKNAGTRSEPAELSHLLGLRWPYRSFHFRHVSDFGVTNKPIPITDNQSHYSQDNPTIDSLIPLSRPIHTINNIII